MSRLRDCVAGARPYLTQSLNASWSVPRELLRPPPRQCFSVCARKHQQEPVRQRYGTANEPPPHLFGRTEPKDTTQSPAPAPPPGPAAESSAKEQEQKQAQQTFISPQQRQADDQEELPSFPEAHQASSEPTTELIRTPSPMAFNMPPPGSTTNHNLNTLSPPDPSTALAAILRRSADQPGSSSSSSQPQARQQQSLPPPEDSAEEKPPHLEAPPYVHHFDTYTLVSSLQDSNTFTPDQSITLMKAVRSLLASHMDLARDGLVSKSDAEMTTYLTRAASSELRTEMSQRRKSGVEAMRAERTQLQHEVEVLSQRITAETSALKDELKGMFDDRKMAARMERRRMENATQELNYRITIALNSEMRQEVEGLRFILTRRTVLALAGIVMMCVGMLQAVRIAKARKERQLDEQEKRRRQEGLAAGLPGTGERLDVERGVAAVGASGDADRGGGGRADDAGLVSLG
ncbi:MAG: hypothetical protein M1828_006092 [Chrysothrix sp. TS-e1954]|nr:MAG: hypothetical protein M1828_006092 [Chrysothrix sp. TS-e1954]